MNAVLNHIKPEHAELAGQTTLQLEHNLHQTDLFSDAALARLLETYPRSNYNLHTMDPGNHDIKSWREGDMGACSGEDMLSSVANGKLWLNLRNVSEVAPEYGAVVDAMFAQFEQAFPGFETFKRTMGILISSPGVQCYYHMDVPGQMLWQIRGRKKVYVYPPKAPFLSQADRENVITNRIDDLKIRYESWFDDYSDVREIGPGEMLYWPLHSPHRVKNLNCLNVSLTTEFYTRDIRNFYAVNYANGLLRHGLGLHDLSMSTSGPVALGKIALAALHKFSGIQKRQADRRVIDFTVDPSAQKCVRDIAPVEFNATCANAVNKVSALKAAVKTPRLAGSRSR